MRALIGFGSNMLLAHADGGHGRKALAELEFFAHADLFMTPTAELADVVLPIASSFEREALKFGFEVSLEAQSHVQFRQAVVPPPGEARPDTDIIFDLAARLGLAEQFWNGDIEAAYRHQLAPTGITLEQLRGAPGGVRVRLQTRHAKQPRRTQAARRAASPRRRAKSSSSRKPCSITATRHCPISKSLKSVRKRGPTSRRASRILTCAKSTLFCQTQRRALPSLRKREAGGADNDERRDHRQVAPVASGDDLTRNHPGQDDRKRHIDDDRTPRRQRRRQQAGNTAQHPQAGVHDDDYDGRWVSTTVTGLR